MFMGTSISQSPAETIALGREWGHSVESGVVIALIGDLGAGKTQLVKGLAEGLGIQQPILSPTFALVNVYTEGRLPLFHLDLYRLENRDQVLGAGLEPYFCPEGVAVIEWAERWFGTKPAGKVVEGQVQTDHQTIRSSMALPRIRWVEFEIPSESERRITYEDISA
jgi:tRNA threonylcarbamoyladenosine biosynthesis protein TsaE